MIIKTFRKMFVLARLLNYPRPVNFCELNTVDYFIFISQHYESVAQTVFAFQNPKSAGYAHHNPEVDLFNDTFLEGDGGEVCLSNAQITHR